MGFEENINIQENVNQENKRWFEEWITIQPEKIKRIIKDYFARVLEYYKSNGREVEAWEIMAKMSTKLLRDSNLLEDEMRRLDKKADLNKIAEMFYEVISKESIQSISKLHDEIQTDTQMDKEYPERIEEKGADELRDWLRDKSAEMKWMIRQYVGMVLEPFNDKRIDRKKWIFSVADHRNKLVEALGFEQDKGLIGDKVDPKIVGAIYYKTMMVKDTDQIRDLYFDLLIETYPERMTDIEIEKALTEYAQKIDYREPGLSTKERQARAEERARREALKLRILGGGKTPNEKIVKAIKELGDVAVEAFIISKIGPGLFREEYDKIKEDLLKSSEK